MKKIALLICLAVLLGTAALAQRDRDSDVPVLKRRPAPEQDSQDSPSQGDSRSSAQQEPAESSAAEAPEAEPPPPPRTPGESGRSSGDARRNGDAASRNRDGDAPRNRRGDLLQRGNADLGFDPQQTTPQFLLTRGGGAIRVTVNDPEDVEEAGKIGIRLRELAARFARGEGGAQLRELRGKITYTAHSIEDGGEMIISSTDQKAVTAIHQFLQQQQRGQTSDGAPATRR